MSPLVIAWSMCAGMCLMLGSMHLLFWFSERRVTAYLLSATMGYAAAVSAILELALLTTRSAQTYNVLLRWENLAIYLILVPMVWFVHWYFRSGRRWLAITITLVWSIGIVINFLSPGNLTFDRIIELKQLSAFWGEPFTVAAGEINPWKLLADISSLLILLYTLDATVQLWRKRQSKRAWTVGGAIVVFILFAGIHTPLVDARLVTTPYMISFAFLAIVCALSYQVVIDAVKMTAYQRELQQTRNSLNRYARANLLGECTSMLAHELNQPLMAILSNAQAARRFLASDAPDLKEVHEILNDIVHDNKRASGIIHRLRKMLLKEEVVREWFDLNSAATEIIDILRTGLVEKDVELSVNYAPDLPPVYAGRIEIQQVILNLLLNAAESLNAAPSQNRTIHIGTRIVDGIVLFEVRDSGPGISSEIRDSLFDSFVSDKRKGLGVGLAICRRIIETYRGNIWADNAAAGGAVFSFTLPMKK